MKSWWKAKQRETWRKIKLIHKAQRLGVVARLPEVIAATSGHNKRLGMIQRIART